MNFSKLRGLGRRKASAALIPQATVSGVAAPSAKRAPALLATLARAARWRFPSAATAPWLLLVCDIGGIDAAIVDGDEKAPTVVDSATSRQADFAAALGEVVDELRARGRKIPKRVALAASHCRPLVADLPVDPAKPRPASQMRELLRGEGEAALAEFGGLWTIGALLQARSHLSADDRQRVVLEESVRRQQRRTPLRYGETALELGLIERAQLAECLELQATLQQVDGQWLAAWKGWADDGQRHWLASALSGQQHRQWRAALARRALRLEAVLPLAWLCSETPAGDDAQQISVEVHAEDVHAVARRHGRIVAARCDARLERPLQADWLLRLVEDWTLEGRSRIEIVCRNPADQDAARRVAGELELASGQPARAVDAEQAKAALWLALAREARAAPGKQRLPRLTTRELRGAPWKNADLRRVAALLAIVALLAASEGVQRYRLRTLRHEFAERVNKENETKKLAQLEMKVNSETRQVGKDLETLRAELEPLINTRTRLEAIVVMRQHLPDLMQMLARAVGDDAVLEKVGNSKAGSDAASIRVEAWSGSYTGAQDFVNRVAEQTQTLNYGVAQTEINEARGRSNKMGYRVAFWLLPEADDLEQPATAKRSQP
jgi:hypothetical protein